MPRLYREAPINGIWEGSGNVICLDVLRAMQREPRAISSIIKELEAAKGAHGAFDAEADNLKIELSTPDDGETRARSLTERMAIALQASLLLRHAPSPVAVAFCNSRLGSRWTGAYGGLPRENHFDSTIERAMPTS